jgi:protoporphyrin/coproporphyrin ferrochelatase
MSLTYDAVLLLGFGGPTSPGEVRPFLARVLSGVSIPQARVEEVVQHYEAVGGRSPLNEITFRQAQALQSSLRASGLPLGIYVGLRHSTPFLLDTLRTMMRDGVQRALGFILSSLQADASWERYKREVAQAREELGAAAPMVDFCPGWHDHPLFIETWTTQIRSTLNLLAPAERESTPLVFTAHSLPLAMAGNSPYARQLEESARLIAAKLGHGCWSIAYQSRSGRPSDPWLEPDILRAIRDLAAKGARTIIVAPVGFVCDHVEVLYDLDVEAKTIAAGCGSQMLRVPCPNDHPSFIRMMARVIENCL